MKIKAAVVFRIKELCTQNNIKYNELAVRSGVTPSTVYSILDENRKEISANTIQKLCDGLKISTRQFYNSTVFDNVEQEIE